MRACDLALRLSPTLQEKVLFENVIDISFLGRQFFLFLHDLFERKSLIGLYANKIDTGDQVFCLKQKLFCCADFKVPYGSAPNVK